MAKDTYRIDVLVQGFPGKAVCHGGLGWSTIVLLRGHGSMRLGDDTRPVAEGSVLYVPRGTVHAFRNGGGRDDPSFAHVIYAPPFDGEDRVLVSD